MIFDCYLVASVRRALYCVLLASSGDIDNEAHNLAAELMAHQAVTMDS